MNSPAPAMHRDFILFGMLAPFTLLGMTGKDQQDANSFEVSGRVTLDGKPVTLGTVTFMPENSGPLATAKIGSEGTYTLKAVPGNYKVTVVTFSNTSETVSHTMQFVTTKYVNGNTSTLTSVVTPEPVNTYDITMSNTTSASA